jgi:muconolactone delta-isomerase
MEYLVEMTLASTPKTPEEGIMLMENYILPTLAIAKKLKQESKIISGGPMVGKVGIAMIMKADSSQELDGMIDSLPVWSRMQTTVIPLTSFEGREMVVKQLLETTKNRIAEAKAQHQNQ